MKTKKKDVDYFEYFRKSAQFAKTAAEYLDEIFKAYNKENFKSGMDKIHELEHAADANRHEMIEALAKEFIPPIEREDIVALAHELDDVVDAIDDVALRVYMFDVDTIRPEAKIFTELIIRGCDALLEAVTEFRGFRNSKTLKDMLITVNTLESEGDTLHGESVRRLFTEKTDPMETIVWLRIFDGMEECLDACEGAVNIIESVVMKNS